MDSTLELRDVNAFYGISQALFEVRLEAKSGQVACLVGLNGMGKTTTLRSIAGWVSTTGSMQINGAELPARPHQRARARIAYVPEERRVFGSLTVEENLKVVQARQGSAGRATETSTLSDTNVFELVYDLFPRLKERISQQARTLSGGEQQMLAVGRAIVARPLFLLLDEPNEGLAPQYMETISHSIKTLRDLGVGIVLVEQSWTIAESLGDRFYLLENGQVVDVVDSSELEHEPERIAHRIGV